MSDGRADDDEVPPPPPPHGEDPKTTSGGLPPGPYDIFIIPPHSSGSGFLYLPSLKPQTNSFVAGYISALFTCGICAIFYSQALAIYDGLSSNGLAVFFALSVGVGGWLFGRSQAGILPHNPSGSRSQNNGFSTGKKETPATGVPPPASPPSPPPPSQASSHDSQHKAKSPSPKPKQSSGWNREKPNDSEWSGWNRERSGSRPAQDKPTFQPPKQSTDLPKPHTASHIPSHESTSHPDTAQKKDNTPCEPARKPDTSKSNLPGAETSKQPSGPKPGQPQESTPMSRPYASTVHSKYNPNPKPDEGLTPGNPPTNPITSWSSRSHPVPKYTANTPLNHSTPHPPSASAHPSSNRTSIPDLGTKQDIPGTEPPPATSRTPHPGPVPSATAKGSEPSGPTLDAQRAAAKARWDEALLETKRKREAAQAALEKEKKREEDLLKLKEMRARDAKERADREAKEGVSSNKKSTYAFSATGEKTAPWPNGRPLTPPQQSEPRSTPFKSPPAPRAETYRGTDEDAYSYRPYDQPKHKKTHSSSQSESSYASHTTSTTTPPRTQTPYVTNDPDKIVIKAVYMFDEKSRRTPAAQLISGLKNMSDGMILRIDTAGLWIDDDINHEGQRDWDVKAWTLASLEVWCPACVALPHTVRPTHRQDPVSLLFSMNKRAKEGIAERDALCEHILERCRDYCMASPSASSFNAVPPCTLRPDFPRSNKSPQQTGKNHKSGYHLLRATMRNSPEGQKFVFVMAESEAWKVMVGIGKLRKGSQVRSLQVSSMDAEDAKQTLENAHPIRSVRVVIKVPEWRFKNDENHAADHRVDEAKTQSNKRIDPEILRLANKLKKRDGAYSKNYEDE